MLVLCSLDQKEMCPLTEEEKGASLLLLHSWGKMPPLFCR